MKQNEKKPKIAVFIDQLVLGGVQKDAIEEVRMLGKLGSQAKLVSLMRSGFKPKYLKYIQDIPFEFLSDRYPPLLRHSFKFPVFSFFSTLHLISPFLAPFFVKKREWDIIVAHGTTTCLTTLVLKTRSIEYIAIIHDPMEYILKQVYKETLLKAFFGVLSPILYMIERAIVKNAKSTVVVSNVHAPFIEKTYKIKPVILTAGSTLLERLPRKRQKFLLAASRWELGKNPILLLKILEKIPKTLLVVAGSWTKDEELKWFKGKIRELKLVNRVKIYSPLSDIKLKELYSKALAWIHPNFEAFGIGGLEAAAHGCPIIIPKGSGVTELFEDQRDGLFPQKTTLSDFLPAVQALISDPKRAYLMGKSAYSTSKIYSWENHTKRLISIINEFLFLDQKIIIALETGHSSESYLAGGDKLLEKMATYFPDNYKLKIILPEIGTKHWLDSKLKNVKLIILPHTIFDNNPNPTWVFLAYLARIWHAYWRLRKTKKIDLIYSSTNVLPDIAPAFLFKLTHHQIPWIARVHHQIASPTKRPGRLTVNLVSYLMQTLSNFMIRNKSTLTLALNNRLVKTLTYLKFPKNKLQVLGAGIDFPKINDAKNFKEKSFDGIFIGRIHPAKGIYDLIKIWKIVINQKPDAKAIIVGEGAKEEKSKILTQIKKAKLGNNLKLAGYLPENKLYSTLKSSKIFLFTDYEAGWGLAIGEAMAAGLPTVGYDLDIFGDIYKQGFVTVPIADTQKFADQILNLLNDDKSYTKLTKLALTQAKRLSWQQTSRKFQKIVNKLV